MAATMVNGVRKQKTKLYDFLFYFAIIVQKMKKRASCPFNIKDIYKNWRALMKSARNVKNTFKFLIFQQQQQQRTNTNNQTSYVKEEQHRQMLTAAHATMHNGRSQNSNTLPSCNGCRELKRWDHIFLQSHVSEIGLCHLIESFPIWHTNANKILWNVISK